MKVDFDNAITRDYKKGDVVSIQFKDGTNMGYYQIIYCVNSNGYGALRLEGLHFFDFEADTPKQVIDELMKNGYVYEDKKENMGLPAFSSLYIYAGTSGNGF